MSFDLEMFVKVSSVESMLILTFMFYLHIQASNQNSRGKRVMLPLSRFAFLPEKIQIDVGKGGESRNQSDIPFENPFLRYWLTQTLLREVS